MNRQFLEKKHSYKAYNDLRKIIIREFKLHIQDEMTYDQFKSIYDKYGNDIKDSDFARVIFDVDYIQFQKVKRGDHRTMRILSFEYYTENDFWRIRKEIFQSEKYIFSYGLSYEKILLLHSKYGEKFSLEMFSEHVLGIHGKILTSKKSKLTERTDAKEINLEQIRFIQTTREKIGMEPDVYIGSEINYEKLHELYIKYCPNQIIDERTFAIRILAIKDDTYSRMPNKPLKKVKILVNYPINPEHLASLRREVIEENEFVYLQQLSAININRVYKRKGGVYSKNIFLHEIFDINPLSYSQLFRKGNNISILSDSNIELFIKELQEKITRDEKLENNQLIRVDRIKEIYKMYGSGFDEKYFCVEIIGMSLDAYSYLDDTAEVRVFTSEKARIFNRHTIEGKQLSEKEAEKRRASRNSYNLRKPKSFKKKKEEESDKKKEEESDKIKYIRKQVIEKQSLHKGDLISVRQFEEIYKEYEFVINRREFAKYVLDIMDDTFCEKIKNSTIENYDTKNIKVLSKEFMTDKQIYNLKKEAVYKVRLDDTGHLSLSEFNRIYYKTKHTLSRNQFAQEVLGMTYSQFYMLDNKKTKRCRLNIEELKKSIQDEIIIGNSIQPEVTYEQKIDFAIKNTLHRRKEIDIDRFTELYANYLKYVKKQGSDILSEKRFALHYLDIKEKNGIPYKREKMSRF